MMNKTNREVDRGEFDVESNPVLHTPYEDPQRHWHLNEGTGQAENRLYGGRRPSSDHREYVAPKRIAQRNIEAKRRAKIKEGTPLMPLTTHERRENEAGGVQAAHDRINRLRELRKEWADAGYPGATSTTLDLLHHWRDQAADAAGNPDALAPYFCQREAVETIIWLREAGPTHDPQAHEEIMRAIATVNEDVNESIMRLGLRMATGTGKTRTMQMLICWAAANATGREPANILAITPGLTVKDRLQELIPKGNGVYEGLAPKHLLRKIRRARVRVVNYHKLKAKRSHLGAWDKDLSQQVKDAIGSDAKALRKEEDDEVLARVCGREFTPETIRGTKWLVLNDEAHHCYKPGQAEGDRKDEEIAGIWFQALRKMQELDMIDGVVDLSATPMWIRQAHSRKQADMFRWVVSNYPLPEAIEAGLVKTPQLPTEDDANDEYALFRNLHEKALPKGWSKRKPGSRARPKLPQLLKDALEVTYRDYEKRWQQLSGKWDTEPIAIVVASDIRQAQAIYEYIAGRRKKPSDPNSEWIPGEFDLWSNVDPGTNLPHEQCPTILVHSKLGDATTDNTTNAKGVAESAEVHMPPELRDSKKKGEKMALIRRIFNSVGRANTPGCHIRMVISIAMLTEGWDAKNVTHIVGYRAFGTQLLCEQVVGRGLRRSATSIPNPNTGRFEPEVVKVFGVPFDFLTKVKVQDRNDAQTVDIKPAAGREHLRIEVPVVEGYRIRMPESRLTLDSDRIEPYDTTMLNRLSPTATLMEATVGENEVMRGTIPSRERCMAYIARDLVARWVEHDPDNRRLHTGLLRSAMTSVEDWLNHDKVTIDADADLADEGVQAAIAMAVAECCAGDDIDRRVVAIPATGESRSDTTRSTGRVLLRSSISRVRETVKSELPLAVFDSNLEANFCQVLDGHDDIEAWARNAGLGFTIPYTDPRTGRERDYAPDFIARLTPQGSREPTHLILETKGIVDEESIAKARTATEFWCPGVTNSTIEASDGHWHYAMITGDEDLVNALDAAIRKARSNA